MGLVDDAVEVGVNREFRMAIGTFKSVPIGICSTGIGGPSAEIATVELANLGITTVVRTGGMGALSPGLDPGVLVIVETAVGKSGAAAYYTDNQQLEADTDLCNSLVSALTRANLPFTSGLVCSSDSYYVGQQRSPDHPHLWTGRGPDDSAFLGFDMESQTVFAVAKAMQMRAAALLMVQRNRSTHTDLVDPRKNREAALVEACCLAIATLEVPIRDPLPNQQRPDQKERT